MMLQSDAIHCRLYRTIEQFDHQDQHHGADQQRALDAIAAEQYPPNDDRHGNQEFLPESCLVAVCPAEAPPGCPE